MVDRKIVTSASDWGGLFRAGRAWGICALGGTNSRFDPIRRDRGPHHHVEAAVDWSRIFLHSVLTYASPGWFSFFSVTNVTKLGIPLRSGQSRHHRLPLVLPCFFAQRRPCIPYESPSLNSFCRQSPFLFWLARLRVKPKLFRSSWRVFAPTLRSCFLLLPPGRLSPCPPYPPWNQASFGMELTHSTPCSSFDLFLAKVQPFPPHRLVISTDGFVFFSFWQRKLWCSLQLLTLWR